MRLQIAGVLVLAAGVPAAFDGDFRAITVGYALMRVGPVSLWLRVAHDHPAGRRTAHRYAAGVSLLQVVWLAKLAVPGADSLTVFTALALVEMAVPVFAERPGRHPGTSGTPPSGTACSRSSSSARACSRPRPRSTMRDPRMSAELGAVAASGLAVVIGLWWLYFAVPSGAGLERRRGWSLVRG